MSNQSQELAPIQALKNELPTLTRLLELSAGHGVDARAMVEQEIEFLRLLSLTTPAIAECNAGTVVLAMKSILRKNLSLDPGSKLVYAKTRNQKVKVNGQDRQIKVLELQPSCRGELSYAYQCGSILDHENPQCEYDASGRVTKVWMRLLRPSSPSPRWEKYEYSEYDFERWMAYSHKDRGRWKDDFGSLPAGDYKYANELYRSWRGGIDPEFAKAKCIRRSLDKLGTNNLATAKSRATFDPSKFAVDVDHEKDAAAAHDEHTPAEEAQYAEVVSSTPHPEQPASNGSTVNADEL